MESAANYGSGCAHHHQTDEINFGGSPDPNAPPAPVKFEAWGYVELMGHNRIAGRLSEQAIAGRNLLRVDVPLEDGTFRTQYYGGSAIFGISPTSEEVARKLVERMKPEPVFAFMLERTPRIGLRDPEDPDFDELEDGGNG